MRLIVLCLLAASAIAQEPVIPIAPRDREAIARSVEVIRAAQREIEIVRLRTCMNARATEAECGQITQDLTAVTRKATEAKEGK